MGTPILAVSTLLLYSLGTVLQALLLNGRLSDPQRMTLIIGLLGLSSHVGLTIDLILIDGAINLSFLALSVLVSAMVVALVLAISLVRPVQNLLLGAYPFAMLTVIGKLLFFTHPKMIEHDMVGVLAHVSLALTAYSLFALAAMQALLLYLQHRQLKAHRNSALIRGLPPLQTMESILFGLIRAGVILLTLAIVTGALFMEDLFGQQLAHKTFFTLFAWVVFTGLLVGRQLRGWRAAVASRWTLLGGLLLTLGYFGSRIVIEWLL